MFITCQTSESKVNNSSKELKIKIIKQRKQNIHSKFGLRSEQKIIKRKKQQKKKSSQRVYHPYQLGKHKLKGFRDFVLHQTQ